MLLQAARTFQMDVILPVAISTYATFPMNGVVRISLGEDLITQHMVLVPMREQKRPEPVGEMLADFIREL